MELVVPFVRYEFSQEHPDFSPQKFLKFVMNALDPNYAFIADLHWNFLILFSCSTLVCEVRILHLCKLALQSLQSFGLAEITHCTGNLKWPIPSCK
jgi:hypothetical protein